jgi:hypothetical protein
MSRSRESARARRRPVIPARTGRGNYVNYGPQALDQVSGLPYPKRLMVPQRGGLVSMDWADGTRDAVDPIDHRIVPPPQPAVPVPFYRVFDAVGLTLIITSESERDDVVPDGYFWTVLGYAYTDGDEEDGLALLYRSFKSSTGDHLFTTSAAEHASAIGSSGYTAETPDAYVFTTSGAGRIPIYRAYKASAGIHTWHTDLRAIERLGVTWAYEELSFYVLRGPERTRS